MSAVIRITLARRCRSLNSLLRLTSIKRQPSRMKLTWTHLLSPLMGRPTSLVGFSFNVTFAKYGNMEAVSGSWIRACLRTNTSVSSVGGIYIRLSSDRMGKFIHTTEVRFAWKTPGLCREAGSSFAITEARKTIKASWYWTCVVALLCFLLDYGCATWFPKSLQE